MSNKIFVVLIIVAILLFVSLSQEEPLDLSLSIDPCLGGNTCFIGEILKLNIKLNPSNLEHTGTEKSVDINPENFGTPINEKIIVGNESKIKIPISLSIKEGPYTLTVNSNLEDYGDIWLKIKHFIWDLIGKKYTSSKIIELRYPKIKIEELGYKCNNTGFYIEEIKLKLEEPLLNDVECKIRIVVDKLVSTNHKLLVEGQVDEQFHYYETEYSKINKADLTGAIQKIEFLAGPAIQQTNTRLVPICLIEDRDIEIKNQERLLEKCSVNKKGILDIFKS